MPGLLALDGGTTGGGAGEGGWMLIEWVKGKSVRDCLRGLVAAGGGGEGKAGDKLAGEEVLKEKEEVKALMWRIGAVVGGLHKVGIVHGDLTTSNMMVKSAAAVVREGEGQEEEGGVERELEGEIVLIDFGLAAQSVSEEDRAVDLYVLERAFGSTHPELEGGFGEVEKGYAGSFGGARVVLKKLEEVRLRGRKRSMLG